jgi:hypothetical protein
MKNVGIYFMDIWYIFSFWYVVPKKSGNPGCSIMSGVLTCMTGKMSPTARLPVQLTKTATAMAAGLGSMFSFLIYFGKIIEKKLAGLTKIISIYVLTK